MNRGRFDVRSVLRRRGAHGWTGTDALAGAVGTASTADTADAGAVRAPGLAAMLRRNPRLKRHAAIGSVAAGAVLFVIASLTTPLAGAKADHHSPLAVDALHAAGGDLSGLLPLATDTPAPVEKVVAPKPVHVAKPAPATPAVINSLAANGIPNIALNAYRVAAVRMDHVDPGCGIDWALLAGIGRVESDHGRYGGAVFNADGTTDPRIIGPALDGTHYDYVPAPANGMALDGDAVYAHALGPMQFIPQTWAGYGADENGDGVADVFNINDAALGAARYLCAAGGDLRSTAGQKQAVLTYNNSDEYLAQVLALADAYRRGVSTAGIPIVGNTSGSLSPVRTTDVPPANPGNPTAVQPHAPNKTSATTIGPTHGNSTAPAGGRTSGTKTGTTSVAPVASTTPAGPTSTAPGAPVIVPPAPTTAPAPPATTSAPPPPATSGSPSPSPTKKCVVPDPFDTSKCWV